MEDPSTINGPLRSGPLPFAIALQHDLLAGDHSKHPGYQTDKAVNKHPELLGGLYYRPVFPVRITLLQCAEAASCSDAEGKPVEAAMRASGFGKNTSKLAFDHGLLTS